MSELTEALDRILTWIEENEENSLIRLESLQLGLTCQEIDEITACLPFRLPVEVCELYQWANGAWKDEEHQVCLFNNLSFLSLEVAIETYHRLPAKIEYWARWHWEEKYWNDDPPSFEEWAGTLWDTKWFPIALDMESETQSYIVVGSETQQLTSPLLSGDFEIEYDDVAYNSEQYIIYSSLTQMVLAEAECYEAGVYWRDRSRNSWQDRRERHELAKNIRQKYQPATLKVWRG